jgi:DDE family transposase
LAQGLLKNCAKIIEIVKTSINSSEFINKHKSSPKDFSRKRALPFPTLFIFICNFLRSSIQEELDRFFQAIYRLDIPLREATASAFCQARNKLQHTAFIEITRKSVETFYTLFSTRKWHGFRLLAVDGSTAVLPDVPAIEEHFGVWKSRHDSKPCPMARLSQMFDVLNDITIDAFIGPKSVGERDAARNHFRYLGHNDLLLLDRGYPAFWLFQLIIHSGAQFCARFQIDLWTKVKTQLFESTKNEMLLTLESSSSAVQKCKELGLPITPVTLRFIKIQLENGEIEILVTTLTDSEKYCYDVFKELYFKRWPVEEQYKFFKSRIEIENFTGKSVLAVKQDFYARVLMSNLAAMLSFSVEPNVKKAKANDGRNYQINKTRAAAKMKNAGILLFFRDDVLKIINDLFRLFAQNLSIVRPNRKYQRIARNRRFAFAYKSLT